MAKYTKIIGRSQLKIFLRMHKEIKHSRQIERALAGEFGEDINCFISAYKGICAEAVLRAPGELPEDYVIWSYPDLSIIY